MKPLIRIAEFIRSWRRSEDGVAAVEAAMVFPILLTLLMGTFDLGNGILANQKTIRASQVAADLLTRTRNVDDNAINEAVEASELALQPMDTASYGIDIVSIRFDEDAEPEIVWRETRNMLPKADVLADVMPLAEAGNGVLVVSVRYLFEPAFAGFVVNQIPMQEVAFAKGRKSSVVSRT